MGENSVKKMLSALVWIMFLPFAYAEEVASAAQAVNIAGQQRMFTMRLLRDYIMIGEKLHYKDPAADLQKTITRYENSQKALEAYIKDPKLTEELKTIEKRWNEIKKLMAEPPQKSRMAEYAQAAIGFREMLNTFVNHLADASDTQAAQAVNLSGRLRAVSQALAAIYQLHAWGMADTDQKMKIPMKRFRGSLDYLTSAKETAPPMQAKLKELEKIYRFFEVMNTARTITPTLAIKKTDTMLEIASELTMLYVQAAHQKE